MCVCVHELGAREFYGVMTGSLGKVEFNDFFIALRAKWVLVLSIPEGSGEVTSAFMETVSTDDISLVSEGNLMWILWMKK